ncbi:MAG: RluA family pseudouridine synthase [Lactobacillus sp.]|nr:RluA family pseudouridine synthase [Lactobacillus sp.]
MFHNSYFTIEWSLTVILERHFTIKQLPQPLSLRAALNYWLIPRKWQHELRVNRSILVNHHYQSFNTLLHNGDHIDLAFSAKINLQTYLPAPQITFTICQENQDFLIVNKPAGLKTHPNQPQENKTLLNQIKTYLGYNPLMIHRLDKMTSGLIMVGKNPLIIPVMNRQLSQKIMQRYYLAVTKYNATLPNHGSITAPIGRDDHDPRKRQISSQGLFAQTDYQIIQHNQKYALVKLQLHTGRTHQIRVHLQSIGLPILGDPLYGPPAARMYLHAYQLQYQLPFTQQKQTVTIKAPASFQALVQA